MDSFRALLRRVPLGDKTFLGFQKGRLKVVILKVSNTLLRPQLKWKESKWTPLVSAFAESLRGIKSTTHSKYWKYIHGCGDTLCRIQFLFILVYCLRYKISFHRYRSYIKVDTKFIQNPPPLATAGTWPKMWVMMVSILIQNGMISILPYYITFYYNLQKNHFYHLIYHFN